MIVEKWWVSLKYNLINATNKDTDYIKKSKLYNIFTYADDLQKDEVMRINNYVDEHGAFYDLRENLLAFTRLNGLVNLDD